VPSPVRKERETASIGGRRRYVRLIRGIASLLVLMFLNFASCAVLPDFSHAVCFPRGLGSVRTAQLTDALHTTLAYSLIGVFLYFFMTERKQREITICAPLCLFMRFASQSFLAYRGMPERQLLSGQF